jgi:hypothetical protein
MGCMVEGRINESCEIEALGYCWLGGDAGLAMIDEISRDLTKEGELWWIDPSFEYNDLTARPDQVLDGGVI